MAARGLRTVVIASVAVVVAMGIPACATPELPALQRPRLLILPANFDHTAPDALQPGVEKTVSALEGYATEQGFVCERIARAEVVEAWEPSVREAGGLLDSEGDFDEERLHAARAVLVRSLVADREVEAVLVPTIEIKQARYNSKGTRAVWDGVSRLPRLGGQSNIFKRRQLKLSGGATVTSLWVTLYDPSGALLASGRGGLEIMQWLNIVSRDNRLSSGEYYSYEWTDRDDLFQDPSKLRYAIELAMDPVLEAAPRSR